MELTAGTKAAAIAAAAAMGAGLWVVFHGDDDLASRLGGVCLALAAMTLIALLVIRTWVTNTSDERRILAAATRAAQAERNRYIAAQAALENEQGRLQRDMAADRARNAARLVAEREALAAEFEETRNQLIRDAITESWMIFLGGGVHEPAAENVVIPFPTPEQTPTRAAERSREHGAVRP